MSPVSIACGLLLSRGIDCALDGEPTGEPPGTVVNVIKGAKNLVSNSQYGPGAVAFEFAQVGKVGQWPLCPWCCLY